MITPTMGFILLLVMLLITAGAFFACLFSGSTSYNPNAKHYCCNCRELEWDCDCPEC